jgi:hypothetical protein
MNTTTIFDDRPTRQPPLSGATANVDSGSGSTHLSGLNPSLLQDLLRFEAEHPKGQGLDLLEVVAAALRHNRDLSLQLYFDTMPLFMTLRPAARQVQCALPRRQLLALRLSELRVMRVEPAPPAFVDEAPPQPLSPLIWELALRGSRAQLLPEIAGAAAYRANPGADLSTLEMHGTLAHAVQQLRREPRSLREMAAWPGFDTDRAARLLNGLYLHAALIVTRSGAISH